MKFIFLFVRFNFRFLKTKELRRHFSEPFYVVVVVVVILIKEDEARQFQESQSSITSLANVYSSLLDANFITFFIA